MLKKAMHKTRLTQSTKTKHTSNAKTKTRREERKKWLNHLEPFSFHTLEEPSHFVNPWSGGEGEELKSFKFYRIGTSVIHGERRLVKTSGKLRLFYSPSKGGLRNLAQSLLHDLSSYPPSRRTFSPPLVWVLLFIRIGFTGWSFWAFPVIGIPFIVGRNIRA